jgi:acyl-CoA thioester hydrolase
MASCWRRWARGAISRPTFELEFTAGREHIDELGHVNNAVWVQWIQQVAVAHWQAVADAAHRDYYFWVVVRHEIDYLRAAFAGDRILARTWVGEAPRGARFDRFVEFTGPDGKVCVRARTGWAIIDRASGRPIRVPAEVVAPFLGAG